MAMMTLPPIQGPASLDFTCNATPTLVGQVRLMIEYRFAEWGLTASKYADVRDNLLLIAAELLTNAVVETPDRGICVRCFPDFNASVMRFAVWDSSEHKPEATMPALTLATLDLRQEYFDDNGGWGLPLVQALAETYGVTPTKGGKWVWANVKVGSSRG